MRLDAHHGMYPERAFQRIAGRMTLEGKDSPSAPPPPDYTPMANASDHAADVGAQLGREQLAEARRQYDQNYATAKPIVDAQTGLMKQSIDQGNDYYNYMQNTFRPLEKGMVAQAQNEGSDARLEEMAAQAAADMRLGQTQQANMLARQGMRYGYSPAKMAAAAGTMAGANASAVAGAMTGARNNQRNVGWARQMDAAGLGRNLSGSSLGAYGLANQSGNSAMANQMQPGNALMAGMAQGAGMQQAGQAQRVGGYGSILNAQSNAYGSQMSSYNNEMNQPSTFGAILGAAGGLMSGAGAMGMKFSDRRLKEDINLIGVDPTTGLNLYSFAYVWDATKKYIGVMADEVLKQFPQAVAFTGAGFATVNYDLLGIEMTEVTNG